MTLHVEMYCTHVLVLSIGDALLVLRMFQFNISLANHCVPPLLKAKVKYLFVGFLIDSADYACMGRANGSFFTVMVLLYNRACTFICLILWSIQRSGVVFYKRT